MRDSLSNKRFAVDTTFVLFFLGIDFGQSSLAFALDSVFSLLTLGMLLVVPYFLPSMEEKPEFTDWLMGRSVITIFAVGLGIMFRQSLGVLLPETFRFLPFTLVILTAMLSCSLQFYGMIRFRLAR
jgi:hypothetical protein